MYLPRLAGVARNVLYFLLLKHESYFKVVTICPPWPSEPYNILLSDPHLASILQARKSNISDNVFQFPTLHYTLYPSIFCYPWRIYAASQKRKLHVFAPFLQRAKHLCIIGQARWLNSVWKARQSLSFPSSFQTILRVRHCSSQGLCDSKITCQ